jgi:hypothetical protein
MPGTRAGYILARATMIEKFGGEDKYLEHLKSIGAKGGAAGNTCGILVSMSNIKEIPKYPRYKVSDDGQVFAISGSAMKPQIDDKGYLRVLLRDSSKHNGVAPKKVHRLVATTFIPNPNNLPQVDHIDGDKSNNCVSNLEWVTNDENQRRAVNRGAYTGRTPKNVKLYGGQILTAISEGYYGVDLFENNDVERKTFWTHVERGNITPEPIVDIKLGRKKKFYYYDRTRDRWRVETSDGKKGKQFRTEQEAIEYASLPIAGGFASKMVGKDGMTGHQRAMIAGAKGGSISKRKSKKSIDSK